MGVFLSFCLFPGIPATDAGGKGQEGQPEGPAAASRKTAKRLSVPTQAARPLEAREEKPA
jgi:hypothetical protein